MPEKLTPKLATLLDRIREERAIRGTSVRYQWLWQARDGEVITRGVNALLKRGYVSAIYFSGGHASASVTDLDR